MLIILIHLNCFIVNYLLLPDLFTLSTTLFTTLFMLILLSLILMVILLIEPLIEVYFLHAIIPVVVIYLFLIMEPIVGFLMGLGYFQFE